jgi:hypothetical protein
VGNGVEKWWRLQTYSGDIAGLFQIAIFKISSTNLNAPVPDPAPPQGVCSTKIFSEVPGWTYRIYKLHLTSEIAGTILSVCQLANG